MSDTAQRAERLLERLEWHVIRRLDGLLQGDYGTLDRGCGFDLAGLREYQYLDDVRNIDWNVTARLGTTYVRDYFQDRNVSVWLILDLSASMDLGCLAIAKRDVALQFLAVVARILERRGNRVGAILYRDRVEKVIPDRRGRRHVLHILQEASCNTARKSRAATDLAELLAAALRIIPRRSSVLVVSDFISDTQWHFVLAKLAYRHDVAVVRVHDSFETELPEAGVIPIEDAETGAQVLVDTSDAGFRTRFGEAVARRQSILKSAFEHARVDAVDLSTRDDLLDAVLRLINVRRRSRDLRAICMPRARRPT